MATTRPSIGLDRHLFPQQREFALNGSSEAIAPLVDEIIAFIVASGVVPGKEDEIHLALQEALANAVVHGCDGDPSKMIYCAAGCGPAEGVLIVVRDPGPGFAPDALRSPLSGDGLAADHGRGIHMIRQLMDEIRFERNGSELHMRKR